LDNEDLSKLLNDLSKMDKKDLQEGILKVSKLMNSSDASKILDAFKKQ